MRKFKVKVNGEEFQVEVEEITSEVKKVEKVQDEMKAAPAVSKTRPEAKKERSVSPPPKRNYKPVRKKTPVKNGNGAEVKAPLPGLITKIAVEEGAKVEEGDLLFILEAMKMENEITAPVSGQVKSINVEAGTDVDTEQLLAVIE